MRWRIILATLLLISCVHQEKPVQDQTPTLDIPPSPHSPTAPIADEPASEDKTPSKHFSVVEQNGYLFIKFDRSTMPPKTFFVEATYGDSYLGYFVIGDTIAVQKPTGGNKAVLLYYALDGTGSRLLEEPYTAILP